MVAKIIMLENESSIEAKRLRNAMIKDDHNLLSKQASKIILGVTFFQGNGGVGSIKQVNFTPGNKDFSHVKERVNEFDEGNFVYLFTQVEGEELRKKVPSAKFKIKFTPNAGGGSVCMFTCENDLFLVFFVMNPRSKN